MAKLKVGIAGYGVVGKRRKEFIDRHENLVTVALCDKDFSSEGTLPTGEKHFRTYLELLEQDLDVLFVCLTNDVAADVTIAGLEKGLHVFCEKPPGRNVQDIQRVIDVETRCEEQKLMYGFNHRHHDSVKDALEIINSGKLGKVLSLKGVYGKSKLVTFNQPDWRTRRDVAGGGVLLDQGIHMVDLMRLFGGEFMDIHSFISNDFWHYDVEDNAYALMRTDNGIVGMLHSSATQWRHRFNLDINMAKGSVILGGFLSGSKSYGAETLTVVTADPDNDMGDPIEQRTRYNNDPSWEVEIQLFANAILNEDEIADGTSDDALKTMQLVYKIYCADSRWREKYNIDPVV